MKENLYLLSNLSIALLSCTKFSIMLYINLLPFTNTAVTCQSLTSPVNGRIAYQANAIAPFAFETTVTYSCNTNYGLHSGDRVRTCVRSPAGPGMWSGTAPTCEGQKV